MVTRKSDKLVIRKRASKSPRNIWRELSQIGKDVPRAERAALPRDGARNLDHYLDGSPRET